MCVNYIHYTSIHCIILHRQTEEEHGSLPDSSRSCLMAASMGPGSAHSSWSMVIYHLMQQSRQSSTAMLPSHATLEERDGIEAGREGEREMALRQGGRERDDIEAGREGERWH